MNELKLHEELSKKLDDIRNLILSDKDVLTIETLSEYTGFSKHHLYKLTSSKSIPFYKPEGKTLFFKKSEIDSWLLRNRHATAEEIAQEAREYIKGRKIRRAS